MKKQTLIDAIKNTPTFVATFVATKSVYMKVDKGQIIDATSNYGTYRYYDNTNGVTRIVELPASAVEFHGYRPV